MSYAEIWKSTVSFSAQEGGVHVHWKDVNKGVVIPYDEWDAIIASTIAQCPVAEVKKFRDACAAKKTKKK
jgi:hypothetical protein